ncbi:MAG: NAD(P)H-binding protein, partial [Pseudomonadota bacterium]|nr:NAD(P)H-binding protein [Pseudomonadota bacterium]
TPAHPDMRRWKANVIEAAKAAGVHHVVLATGLGASPKARVTFGKWHSETQELVKESGLEWTFVQPTYFMQNLLWQAGNIAKDAVYYDGLGGPVAWVDARDIADVAAEALTGPGHEGKVYGLTGPEALTGEDIATVLSEETGRSVTCMPLSAEDSRAAMIADGMQEEVAAAMVELASIAPKGYLAGIETTVSDVLGRPARRFRDFVAGNRAAFVQ